LFDCYLAEHSGDLVDPPSAEHLADCSACAARYAELAAFMDGLRQGGIAEADALFTPDRLRLQQQQIARRLEQVGRPARVISFPTRLVRRTMSGSPSHGVPRWVAAAVAAGLFVGVAVGAGYQYETHARAAAHMLARQTTVHPLTPIAKRGDAPAQLAADDAFLSDLEVALERPHTRELMAYDALTPHVRDVSNPR
jgi:anti-sigma factor RsiW